MAFDPDAFIGGGAAASRDGIGAFDPDAFVGARPRSALAPVEEKEEPSKLEAGLRGIKQGVTLGFGDEISGALESAFTDKTYKQARDEARANDKAARDAHSTTFGLGQILGGVATAAIPGGGLAKLGTGLAGSIFRGAATGIAAGAGDSEAENIEGITHDAAVGGLVGGGIGAVGHGLTSILGRAPARADKALTESLLDKVPARTQDKALDVLGGQEGFAAVIRGDKLLERAAGKGPEHLLGVVQKQADEIGEKIGSVYKHADKASPGVQLTKVTGALKVLQDKAEAEFDAPAASAIEREITALEKMAKGRELVKASDVHGLVKRYGRAGFSGGDFANPSDARVLGREMNGAVRSVLQDHIDEVAAANPGLGGAAHLRALNAKFSKLSAVEDLADAQATRAARNSPTLGQRFDSTAKALTGAAAFASGNILPIAGYAAVKGGPIATRAASKALAQVVRAARSGNVPARMVQDAISAGVPRATIESTVSGISARRYEPDPDSAG